MCLPHFTPLNQHPFQIGAWRAVVVVTGKNSTFFSILLARGFEPATFRILAQRNNLAVYLVNLSISDLLYTVSLPVWIELALGRPVGDTLCSLVSVVMYNSFYIGSGLLCCISVDRYLAYPILRRLDTAVMISVAIWVLVVSFNASTIIWIDSYNSEEQRAMCLDMFPLRDSLLQVSVARFVLGFLFPVLLVSFCCRGICVAVRANQATEEQERRHVSQLLAMVLLTLGLCFGPIHVMMLLRGLLEHCGRPSWLFLPYKISMAISALNSVADPFLYCFITRLGKANVTQVYFCVLLVYFRCNQPGSSEPLRYCSSCTKISIYT
uniref:G protein-coupled receptor 65 n=1 Tax=Salmo trutta TaxID=8032 RepID=A0A674D1R7_SALTR